MNLNIYWMMIWIWRKCTLLISIISGMPKNRNPKMMPRMTGAHIGPEPTTDRFVVVTSGPDERCIPGNTIVVHAEMPFSGLTTFGGVFLSKFECSQMPHPGKVAIVTASTQGIGFSIAERLGLEGASVVVSSRRQNNVDEAVEKLRARGIEVLGVVCHVSNAQQRKNLIEPTVQKYGKIDVIVSNAAVNPSVDTILETKEAVLDKLWEINVKAAILLLQMNCSSILSRYVVTGGEFDVDVGHLVSGNIPVSVQYYRDRDVFDRVWYFCTHYTHPSILRSFCGGESWTELYTIVFERFSQTLPAYRILLNRSQGFAFTSFFGGPPLLMVKPAVRDLLRKLIECLKYIHEKKNIALGGFNFNNIVVVHGTSKLLNVNAQIKDDPNIAADFRSFVEIIQFLYESMMIPGELRA